MEEEKKENFRSLPLDKATDECFKDLEVIHKQKKRDSRLLNALRDEEE